MKTEILKYIEKRTSVLEAARFKNQNHTANIALNARLLELKLLKEELTKEEPKDPIVVEHSRLKHEVRRLKHVLTDTVAMQEHFEDVGSYRHELEIAKQKLKEFEESRG